MRRYLLLTIALLCAVVQGAWAEGIYDPTDINNESDLNWYISNGFRNLVLKADIPLTNYVAIVDGKVVTIDLNGHDLGRGLTSLTNYGNVIRVETGGTLTIKDSGTGGTITGGYDATGGGICVLGTLNFQSGTISGCNGTKGGAIYITSDGTVNMTGGTISGCNGSEGGAIYVVYGSTFNMTGGTIDGCSASDCGGIYNKGTLTISGGTIQNCTSGQGGGGVVNYAAAYIYGGTITGNTATTRGGGVWNDEDASITVTGGTITSNTAGTNGGGLFSKRQIIMRGNPVITGNTVGGSTNNLYLVGNKQIICDGGAFTTGASIGVTLENYGRKFTNQYSFNNGSTDPATYFTMDNSGYAVATVDNEAFAGAVYVERSWEGSDTDGHVESETKTLTSSFSSITATELTDDGWYVLSGENVFNDRITISADVKFILADGSNAEFKKGIRSGNGSKLTIYAQSGGTGTLRATGSGDAANAAIGATENTLGGSLIIHGGTIEASSSKNSAAGIGGGGGESSGMTNITIYGGSVTATGKENAAGIGAGENNNTRPTITIYGGTVTATGDDYGPGIGGANNRGNGIIKIYGGTITATGGVEASGIGGGCRGDQDNDIYIYNTNVTASGGANAAGIGGGYTKKGKYVYIYGSTVKATGGDDHYSSGSSGGGAGIGGGEQGDGGTVIIVNSNVEAKGGSGLYNNSGSAIGGGYKGNGGTVSISGSTVKVTTGKAAPIGMGTNGASNGTLTLGDNLKVAKDGQTPVSAANRISTLQTTESDDTVIKITECEHSGASCTIKDADYHTVGNCSYCLKGGTDEAHNFGSYGECGICALVSLADNSDNSSTIGHWAGQTKSVVLQSRTLYKDGNWNTLCLPFDVTIAGSSLEGATLKELDTDGCYDGKKTGLADDGTLYLFFKDATSIEAGKPYIVKWSSGDNIVSPVFTDVTISNVSSDVTSTDSKVSVKGNFDPVHLEKNTTANLYVGENNQLYYPTTDDYYVNSFRAYFTVDLSGGATVNAIQLNFGDEEATGIISIDNGQLSIVNSSDAGAWFDMQGRRLQGKPTAKGIYVHNGRKQVIK